MWVVNNNAMNKLFGGDFEKVFEARRKNKKISVRTLYNLQNTYNSYQGFRKFYRKYMEPIIESIGFMSDKSILTKGIKHFMGM